MSPASTPQGWVIGRIGAAPVVVSPTSLLLGLLIAYLSQPQRATAYLHHLDRLKDSDLNDYLQSQLETLITSRQLDTSGQTWHNRLRQHDADLQGLDLNRLHTLYARLSELRRPDRQQIGQTLNIKALLLETCDKRNP